MRFQLPQFIETETKIVGPFTIKQFLWIAAGATMLFLDFSIFQGFIAIILGLPITAMSIALAFLKIDGMPLINYLSNALTFAFGTKRYVYTVEDQSSNNYSQQTFIKQ